MTKPGPSAKDQLAEIMQPQAAAEWEKITSTIGALYEMEEVWDRATGGDKILVRYRRGGKTLVTLIPRAAEVAICLVYGKLERDKFEANREDFCEAVNLEYASSQTYHDGKWMLFRLPDENILRDLPALLAIKRRPNKNSAADALKSF